MSSKTVARIVSVLMILSLWPIAMVTAAPPPLQDKITIIMASDNPMGNVTPFYFETWVGGEMGPYVYDSLFLRSPELKILPGLATSYTVSEDGLTYTVTLREGVKWHDGEPFDAEDVVARCRWMSGMGGTRGASLKGLITDTIKAISPYEVEFHLGKTNPFFADRAFTIEVLPQHVWREIFENPDPGADVYQLAHDFEAKVGSGPFKFVEMERDQTYRFVRNDDYWGPKGLVGEIIVTVIKDRTVMMQALSAGEVDMIMISVDPTAVEQFEKDPAITVVHGPDMANYSLFFCTDCAERGPFDQKVVRQAIAHAIDIDKVVDLVTLGTGTKLTAGYPHPDLWWAPTNLWHEFNPDLANKMLDDAGYKRGTDGVRVTPDGDRMSYTLIADANSPTEVRTAELIKGMLADIGIEVRPEAMDIMSGVEKIWPGYSAVNPRDYAMGVWHWSNYPMINRWAFPMLVDPRFDSVGWANISGYVNPEVQPLVETFLSNPDPDEQRSAELALYDIVAEEVPFVPLFAPTGSFAFRHAKYAGYQYKLGVGIHNRWTFLPESAWKGVQPVEAAAPGAVTVVEQPTDTPAPPTATPRPTPVPPTATPEPTKAPAVAMPTPAPAKGGTSSLLPIGIGVIAVIAVAAFFVLRRGR